MKGRALKIFLKNAISDTIKTKDRSLIKMIAQFYTSQGVKRYINTKVHT